MPNSDAFYELDILAEDYKFPVTAYGDGCSITGIVGRGYEIRASCGNEEYDEGNSDNV